MNVSDLFGIAMNTINMTLPFLVVLTVVVFFHELGHYYFARRNGVHVKIFSIGMGAELFGFTDKNGTRWRLSIIPIGGYVMMFGDSDASSLKSDLSQISLGERSKTLAAKSPWQKIQVAFGGPLMNIILTILIFSCIGVFKGEPFYEAKIEEVTKKSIADKAGLEAEDLIISVNENEINNISELLKEILKTQNDDFLTLTVKRDDENIDFDLKLYSEDANGERKLNALGVSFSKELQFREVSVLDSVIFSLKKTILMAENMFVGLFKKILGKKDSGIKFGSILSIGDSAKKSFDDGFLAFMIFIASLSASLGFVNLLPIPVLDGGNILISFIEMIKKKELSEKLKGGIFSVGFFIVVFLMAYSMWNDIVTYGIVRKLVAFFSLNNN